MVAARSDGITSGVMPSMPGAPPLRLTARQAAVALSRLTTCSIRSSNFAFCGVGAEVSGSRPTPAACSGFSARVAVSPSGVVTGGVAPRGFGSLCVDDFQLFTELGSFVLWPFASVRLFVRADLKRYYGLC